jgi:ABC-type branched-subunit amino acid transport system substrate-binding protein
MVAAIAAGSVVGVVGAPAGAQSGSAPGVTDKEIAVGAVLAKTNPTGIRYQDVVDGAQMYFDIVNKSGGINGRKLRFVKVIDNQSRSSKDILAARSLIEEEEVFAAFEASQEFAGADQYKKAGTPVFGYNIQEEWSNSPNMFGTYGSYLCLQECPQWSGNFVTKQQGYKKPAIFAYGSSPQSADCASSARDSYNKYGPPVAVYDTSLSFGFSANDIAGAVQAIKENGVDFVQTCMDLNGMLNLKKAIEAAGITDIGYLAPQGYDTEILADLKDDLEGMYFLAQFTPFEAANKNPGMQQFLKALKKNGYAPNENYLVGWSGAALLAEGLKAAGKNPTQQGVIDAINKITDWNAGGAIRPVNWTRAHGPAQPGDRACASFVQAKNGKFVPVFGEKDEPIVCIPSAPYPASLDDYITINAAEGFPDS